MKDLLDKLGSYNVFNFLLPGVLFAYFLDVVTTHKLINPDITIGVFIYYFLGLIISRIGSLLLDPFLKKIGFIKFVSYEDFVARSKSDSKIELFSEVNNMHRTFCAMLLLITIVKIYDLFSLKFPILIIFAPYISIVALLMLFLFSYQKQTEYIKRRVTINKLSV